MAEGTAPVELTSEEWQLVAEYRARKKSREAARAEFLDPTRRPTLTWNGQPVDGLGEPELREDRWTWQPHAVGMVDGVLWPDEPMPRAIRRIGFDPGAELSLQF